MKILSNIPVTLFKLEIHNIDFYNTSIYKCWLIFKVEAQCHQKLYLCYELVFIILEQIAAHIGAEIKRMQKRKQIGHGSSSLSNPPSPSSFSQMEGAASNSTEMCGPSSPSTSYFNALSPNKKEVPLFTFK